MAVVQRVRSMNHSGGLPGLAGQPVAPRIGHIMARVRRTAQAGQRLPVAAGSAVSPGLYQCGPPRLRIHMKDVSRGQSAEESRCLSCTRRIGRGIRRTLAGMFLAAIMLGWPLMTAGGRAAGVPAVIATSNANQISERIAADPPSAPIGLTAKAGDA